MSNFTDALTSLPLERRTYVLETLVHHTANGGQYDRLRSLFADHAWMRARITGDRYVYSGFINDLDVAWAALGTSGNTSVDKLSRVLVDYARLGIINSSITSLSHLPINLLVNAAATGCWSIDRVLVAVARCPSAVERLVVYTGLLMVDHLQASRGKVEQLVHSTIMERPAAIPMRFLAQVLPHLQGKIFECVLAQIIRQIDARPLVQAVRSWASTQFTEDDQNIYIDEAISLLKNIPASALTPIVEQIAAAIYDSAVRVTDKLEKPIEKPQEDRSPNLQDVLITHWQHFMQTEHENVEVIGRQLQQIAPYVKDAPSPDTILSRVVAVLESINDPAFQQLVIPMYAPLLHGELLDRVLARTLALSKSSALTQVLTSLAPCLSEAQLAFVKAQVAQFADEQQRSSAMAVLIQYGTTALGHRDEGSLHSETKANHKDSLSDRIKTSPLEPGIETAETSGMSAGLPMPPSSVKLSARFDTELLEDAIKVQLDLIVKGAEAYVLRVGPQSSAPPADVSTRGSPDLPTSHDRGLARQLANILLPEFNPQSIHASDSLNASNEFDANNEEPHIRDYVFALGRPAMIMACAPFLSDSDLHTGIEQSIDLDRLASQVFFVEKVISHLVAEGNIGATDVRRAKGAFLCALLHRGYQNREVLSRIWRQLPSTIVDGADFGSVIDFVLELPVEVERNLFVWRMHSNVADEAYRCPLLEGLAVIVPHLDSALLERAIARLVEIPKISIRRQAITLLAPYLAREQLEPALGTTRTIDDSLEQARALATLAPLVGEREREPVHMWEIDAVLEIHRGDVLGEMLSDILSTEERVTQGKLLKRALDALSLHSPNHRLDALVQLIHKWPEHLSVPRSLLDAVLQLPPVSERGTFSWRAYAVVALIDRFPDELIPNVWETIHELPAYLHIGDPETTKWHWSYSYPFAATLFALVPRLPEQLLDEAFALSSSLYWKPREEIMQRIAARATGELARRMLDHTLTMLETYSTPDLSAETLYRDEGALYVGSTELFRAEREVASAEIIAVLAPRLRMEDLERLLAMDLLFHNGGPRAWLPGKLLPYMSNLQREQMLPSAMVAGMEFLSEDPSRFDLLTMLMPFYKATAEELARPLRELVQKYFPGESVLLLPHERLWHMSAEDREQYKRLVTGYPSGEAVEAMRNIMNGSSDDAKRSVLAQAIFTPLVGAHLDQIILSALLHSPVSQRIQALPVLAQELSLGQFATFVTQTFEDLLLMQHADIDRFTDLLIDLIPFLPSETHSKLLQIIFGLEEANLMPEDELEVAMYGKMFNDLAARPDSHRHGPLLASLLQEQHQEDLQKLANQIRGNRARLAATLLERLDSVRTGHVIHAVLQLPERERFGVMYLLIPMVSDDHKAQMFENILTMRSAFGRTWLLWNSSEHLTEQQRDSAFPAALAAARALRTPQGRIVALFGLLSLADDDRRELVLQTILDSLNEIDNRQDQLRILNVFIHLGAAHKHLIARAAEIALQIQDAKSRDEAFIVLIKAIEAHGNLGDECLKRAQVLLDEQLYDSAKLERASFLRTLAQVLPECQRFVGSHEAYQIASSIHEVCKEWIWL
jgi:hypothetical protein